MKSLIEKAYRHVMFEQARAFKPYKEEMVEIVDNMIAHLAKIAMYKNPYDLNKHINEAFLGGYKSLRRLTPSSGLKERVSTLPALFENFFISDYLEEVEDYQTWVKEQDHVMFSSWVESDVLDDRVYQHYTISDTTSYFKNMNKFAPVTGKFIHWIFEKKVENLNITREEVTEKLLELLPDVLTTVKGNLWYSGVPYFKL